MTIPELEQKLAELEIRADAYTLGSERDESYCLLRSQGKFAVFYSERGNHNIEKLHRTEAAACEDLLARLLRDEAVMGGFL